jgi:ferrochelatase
MRAGLLLCNLGTPDAPTTPALKRYLREFLWDPRVIELPRWKWWLILNLFVLTTRPRKSAEAYKEVWTDEGSPLLVISKQQQAGLAERLGVRVALGMRYGNPSIASALEELRACDRIVVLPAYPQYSATTTASTFDAVFDALKKWRSVPEVRTVRSYHDDPGYIGALAASVREAWKDEKPKRLLMSFHGIPRRYFRSGDPYPAECGRTANLLAKELGLEKPEWQASFQSRFGKEPWITPYTDETLKAWGREGLEGVDVVCPGFSADCLETIEEIDGENREYFEESGGKRYRYVPALNARGDHLDALATIAKRYLT